MTTKNVIEIDDLTFEREVLASAEPFLLDFTARWCGPCRALKPIITKIADEHAGSIRVGTLDIDDSPDVARRLGIRGAPTVIAFRDGREVGRQVGLCREAALLALLE